MASFSSVTDTLFASQSGRGPIEGFGSLRTEPSTAVLTSSDHQDRATVSNAAPETSGASYKSTARTNRLSANSAVLTQVNEAQSGQVQEREAASTLYRMQKAYAAAQQANSSDETHFSAAAPATRLAGQFHDSSATLSSTRDEGVAATVPSMNVAMNPTAASMVLSQQLSLSPPAQQAAVEPAELDAPTQVSSVAEIQLSE